MVWNFLLMWGIFTSFSVADNKREYCPQPPQINFASFATHIYMKGTILDCSCKAGYDRKEGTPFFIVCDSGNRHLSWNGKCQCKAPWSREEQHVTSTSNAGEKIERTQTNTEDIQQSYNLTSHCQEPVLWSHANETKNYHFVVGQKLRYQCLETHEYAESTCMKIDGKPTWTKPHLNCNNVKLDVSTPVTVPRWPFFSTAPTEAPVSPSFATEHKITVAAFLFLVIFVISLVWITWRKRWRLKRQTDKGKTKKREARIQQYCSKNQMHDHPEGLLSA